jgi:xanthine phosphoribosyltransferase
VTAVEFNVPVVFARKFRGKNVDSNLYSVEVMSFTHGVNYPVSLPKAYLGPKDKVLIVDDFLANGCALEGLAKICKMAGAEIKGVGIAIEKGFQNGGKRLRAEGLPIQSLAIIDKMTEDGKIIFRPQ